MWWCVAVASAQTSIDEVRNPRPSHNWISDEAHLLDADEEHRLEARLQALAPSVESVRARWLVVAHLSRSLTGEERAVLEALLDDGSPSWVSAGGGQEVLVGPRPGTISPWSTKATDIAHAAGLDAVERLERVRLFVLGGHAQPQALHALHDRMTEAVLVDVACLFDEARPAPGQQIHVLAHGAVAAGHAPLELAVPVDHRRADAVELGLHRPPELVAGLEAQEAQDALLELFHLLVAEEAVDGQHRHLVGDLVEALTLGQGGADALGGAVGRGELGVPRLELLELAEQGVVLRVGDLGRAFVVVEARVALELAPQGRGALFVLPGDHGRPS